MEIERKFDIKSIPSWMKEKSVRHKKIEQIYLMIDFDNEGKVLEEIRVRKAINLKTNQVDYKMTYNIIFYPKKGYKPKRDNYLRYNYQDYANYSNFLFLVGKTFLALKPKSLLAFCKYYLIVYKFY
jgi:hypothetical protein